MMTLLKKPRPLAYFGVPGQDMDSEAIAQMKMILRHPTAKAGALLPDAHPGHVMPVGGVLSLDRAVAPALVGYDIGCRMALTGIDGMAPDEARKDPRGLLRALSDATFFGGTDTSMGMDHPVMQDPAWDQIEVLKKAKSLARKELGGSGGGNHFANIMTGEVVDTVDWLPLEPGDQFVALLTHSGSRDPGRLTASHFLSVAQGTLAGRGRGIPKDLAWLWTEEEAGRQYLAAIGLMDAYASANHAIIHQKFLRKIRASAGFHIETHHNLAWPQPDGAVIHRKGAIPAEAGRPGLIPGSSASESYIVEGLGNPESLNSCSHGAGRAMSRGNARDTYDRKSVIDAHLSAGVLARGVSPTEHPSAYKDIHRVMALQEGLLARTVAVMKPLVVVMGGSS